ncbi:MAG TPA: VOC family protein [Trebonia sp.]|nr:VOC family protein [Trebonia sp.]
MAAPLRCEIFPADLDATVAFYVSVLGFELVRDERNRPSAYVALARDTVQVGAAARPEIPDRGQRRPVTGVELVLEVDDIDEEHARVAAAGWPLTEDSPTGRGGCATSGCSTRAATTGASPAGPCASGPNGRLRISQAKPGS